MRRRFHFFSGHLNLLFFHQFRRRRVGHRQVEQKKTFISFFPLRFGFRVWRLFEFSFMRSSLLLLLCTLCYANTIIACVVWFPTDFVTFATSSLYKSWEEDLEKLQWFLDFSTFQLIELPAFLYDRHLLNFTKSISMMVYMVFLMYIHIYATN